VVELAVAAITKGGRLVYLGAGTSGRLGALDAAECLPTFGTESVVAVVAGAPASLSCSVEGVEDNPKQAERDLKRIRFSQRDVLVGIAASGRTPYVLGGARYARRRGAKVVAIACDPQSPLVALAEVAVVPLVGPELIAASSRMKAGTAQKLVLNMLSTATMVRLGRVLSNTMVAVEVTNEKLWGRAVQILMRFCGVTEEAAARALKAAGRNLPRAILMVRMGITRAQAARALSAGSNVAKVLRKALSQLS